MNSLKQQAIRLRKQGHLYQEIADELKIAKSTASVWTNGVLLSDTSQQLIAHKQLQSSRQRIANLARLRKARTAQVDGQILQTALATLDGLKLTREHKRLLCAVLFWAEGEKNTAGGVRFINSDPAMVARFLSLLRAGFELDETKFRALVHLHDYHDEPKQLEFWSEVTAIPLTQFHKSYRKPHTGKQIHQDYPGCISVRYHDSNLGKLLKMIYTEFGKI